MPRRLKEFSDFKTVRDLIINNSKEFGNNTAFTQQITKATETETSTYRKWTYSQLYEDVKYLGHIFRELGIKKGDRVALIGNNSYSFTLAFLTLASGIGVPGILPNIFTSESVLSCCKEMDAKFAVCDRSKLELVPDGITAICTNDLLSLIEAKREECPSLLPVDVTIDENNDEAMILFKSGKSKSNRAIVSTNRQIYENVSLIRNEVYISYSDRFLSFSHLSLFYELYCGLFFPMSRGASIIYSTQISGRSDILAANIRKENPTITVVSPHVISEFYTMMWRTLVSEGKIENALNYIKLVNNAGHIRRGMKQNIMDDLHRLFGESLNFIISSGNMLTARIDQGMRAFGIPIINVYGTAECPIAALKSPFAPGSGEKSYIPTDVNIISSPIKGESFGRLMISGSRVSSRYANGEQIGEWVDTNDYGTIDENRTLTLVGKDYNAYVSEYNDRLICPEQLERVISSEYGIAEAYVYPEELSDGRTVLSAKVLPDPAFTEYYGKEHAEKFALETISRINTILLPHKKLKNVEIVFSHPTYDRALRKVRIPNAEKIRISLLDADEVFTVNK